MDKKKKMIQELKKKMKEIGNRIREIYNLPYRFPEYWEAKVLEKEFYISHNQMMSLKRR